MECKPLARARIFFTGVGGQGTLTATKLLGQTALDCGIQAIGGEVHGMAQRGGVVESALLLGGWRAPRIDLGEADILLGFEPLETLRALPYLKRGGLIFSSSDQLEPLSVCLGQEEYPDLGQIKLAAAQNDSPCVFLPCREIGIEAGAPAAGNTALLGALCASGWLPFGVDALKEAIRAHFPAKLHASNLRAIELGAARQANGSVKNLSHFH